METKKPNYTETKAKSPGNPDNFPLGENKEGEYKGEMENMVKPSTLNQRSCSKSNEQNMNNQMNSNLEIAKLAVDKATEICESIEGFNKLSDEAKAITTIFASISVLNTAFRYITKKLK